MNNLLSDEELIELIHKGDETAETLLFERYKDMVVKISRGYFIVGGDLEDLIQEGMIGLYKAINNYSPDKDASFKTFAIICIKHKIQSAIKKANANKNKLLSSAISFQNFSNGDSESLDFLPVELILTNSPDEKVIDKENYEKLKQTIKECLSVMEYTVLGLYLQGYSYKEISKNLQISSKSIDNSLTRIKAKLKKRLANEEI